MYLVLAVTIMFLAETEGLISSVSSAELMVLLICPFLRLSVNLCVKSLLLHQLEFLFDHSEFCTEETRRIVRPCNKAGISNLLLEFQEFHFSLKHYTLVNSYWVILKFLTEKTRHIVPPCKNSGIKTFHLEFQISL